MAELPLLENATLTTEYCRYCLMCRHVCPVGIVTKQERLTPHGWALTIASVKRGLLAWDEETVGTLYACADCGMCQTHCVTDQPLPDAIAAARALVVDADLAPPSVLAVRHSLEAHGNLHGHALQHPPIERGEVALFVGDDALLQEGALQGALDLLAAIDVTPVRIGNGRNNGYLPASLGLRDIAFNLAQRTRDELDATGAHTLLVLTPEDHYAIAQMYGDRLGVTLPEGVEVVEVTTLLANALADGRLQLQPHRTYPAAAYFDPSHAPRTGRDHTAPRTLLGAVLGAPLRELFWSGERGQTSGATALRYTQPAIAEQLARARLEDARASGAEILFTESSLDALHLNRFATEYGITVLNLYAELAAALQAPPD